MSKAHQIPPDIPPKFRSFDKVEPKSKVAVIINSLKVPKIKTILLYEMKFVVPNYSCL